MVSKVLLDYSSGSVLGRWLTLDAYEKYVGYLRAKNASRSLRVVLNALVSVTGSGEKLSSGAPLVDRRREILEIYRALWEVFQVVGRYPIRHV